MIPNILSQAQPPTLQDETWPESPADFLELLARQFSVPQPQPHSVAPQLPCWHDMSVLSQVKLFDTPPQLFTSEHATEKPPKALLICPSAKCATVSRLRVSFLAGFFTTALLLVEVHGAVAEPSPQRTKAAKRPFGQDATQQVWRQATAGSESLGIAGLLARERGPVFRT